jgi:pSer/pThr/pTyr-binding forkhead associated (FHA) protein
VITTAHSCVIEDLNSTNGIYVKSNRVRRHHLNDGDVVLIGKHELIYVDERAARGRGGFSETVPRLDAEGEEPEKAPAQRTVPTLGPAATGGQVPTVKEAAPLK